MRRRGIAALIGSLALAGPATAVAASGPPKVRERFTPLRCSGKPNQRNTIQQEGCAEHRVLALDAKINSTATRIWAHLPSSAARRHFAAAQTQWIRFRHADCVSRSDEFAGGSQAPVVFAQCLAADDAARLTQLRGFLAAFQG